jgi:hypothetical protein
MHANLANVEYKNAVLITSANFPYTPNRSWYLKAIFFTTIKMISLITIQTDFRCYFDFDVPENMEVVVDIGFFNVGQRYNNLCQEAFVKLTDHNGFNM